MRYILPYYSEYYYIKKWFGFYPDDFDYRKIYIYMKSREKPRVY